MWCVVYMYIYVCDCTSYSVCVFVWACRALSNCMSEGDYTVLRALERKDVDSHTGVLSFLRTLLLGEQNEAKMDLDQLLSAKVRVRCSHCSVVCV